MMQLPTSCLVPIASLLISLFPLFCVSQFAPWESPNLTTIVSPVDPGITISYTVPHNVCTTAYETQQQYTGWVKIPGSFTSNMFFWFVAAREPTSALTIWLNGGPGSSSMFGFFGEVGPCEVVELGANRLGTAVRDFGWDRASNMLFIDQPNQVGLSYDVPTNGSLDLVTGIAVTPSQALPANRTALTFINGTFSSLNVNNTANTTETAALAVWHMLQGFLGTFPQFSPSPNGSVGVNLFAESYGGKYGPVFAELWDGMNQRRNGTLANSTVDINLKALGIINGCVDDAVQGPSYASMLVNNSYGLTLLNPVQVGLVNASYYQPNGCLDLINKCRNATAAEDAGNNGNVARVNTICQQATDTCSSQLLDPYADTGLSYYDLARRSPGSFPPSYYVEYLNTVDVQKAIGTRVNFTDSSNQVHQAFRSTGDWQRGPIVPKLAALVKRGVRVGMVYGDLDYTCNWIGGEAVSMSIAATVGGDYAAKFPAAGYAPIIVNSSYIGGVVRQYGNLSFSRIYQAGHFVPAYQPETAFQVFARIILGTSVSTGSRVDLSTYNTTGPLNATLILPLPPSPRATCYIRALAASCPTDTIMKILQGQGVVINGVWYAASSDWPGSASPTTITMETPAGASWPSSTSDLTGIFTATTTPQSVGSRTDDRMAVACFSMVISLVALPLLSLLFRGPHIP